jgi:anti-sigma-K factor RskA
MSELEHTDALAAEYVLGTLDAGERAQARALLRVDPGFVAKVQFWERRLGELHTMVEPVEPEPGLWLRIKARMMEPQATPVGLPEPQNLQPPPAALAAEVPPGDAPSLEEIEATIAEAAASLNADAAQAAPVEASAAPAAEAPMAEAPAAEVPSLDAIEVTISETTVTLSADAAQAASPDAAPASFDGAPTAATSAEMPPAPPAEAAPAPGWAAAPAPGWEAAPAAPVEPTPAAPVLTVTEVADATTAAETTAPVEAPAAETPSEPTAVEPVAPPPEPPPPAAAPVLTAQEKWTPTVEPQQAVMAVRRRLRRWRAFALLMTLVVVAVAALLAAWRFAPERVPPMLRPLELMRQMGVTVPAPAPPPRRPLPPQTQFDE